MDGELTDIVSGGFDRTDEVLQFPSESDYLRIFALGVLVTASILKPRQTPALVVASLIRSMPYHSRAFVAVYVYEPNAVLMAVNNGPAF
jgi:hypothetical protein